MPMLRIPCRYYRIATNPDVECIESNFGYINKELMLDINETALVIVDPWNMDYVASRLKRATEIIQNKIRPAIEAARNCGMKIIYAPSPEIAKKYPQWTRFAGEEEINPSKSSLVEWPPLEFRQRNGKYAEYNTRWGREPVVRNINWSKMDISEVIRPKPEDFVIATGDQLHRLLAYYKILHLFYCGFYADMCVQMRDYGVRAFSTFGRCYNIILLRDATTATECHDTIDDLLVTKIMIREMEMKFGFSTSTEDFIKACNDIEPSSSTS